MPAADLIHDSVKRALIKDGWSITADPYVIEYDDVRLFADLSAERPLAAQRGKRRIVVEVKSFGGASLIHDFEQAFGQYILYRELLAETAPEYEVFLAVRDTTFSQLFQRPAVKLIVERHRVGLVVINVSNEEVVQWIEPRTINASSGKS